MTFPIEMIVIISMCSSRIMGGYLAYADAFMMDIAVLVLKF